jgi:membrane protein YqaA with SNARE-associated domain
MPKKAARASKSPRGRSSPRSQSPRDRASPRARSPSPRGRPTSKAPAAAGDLAAQLKEARADLTWFKRPISVLRLFLLAVTDLSIEYGTYVLQHPYTRYALAPAVLGWLWASEVDGAHRQQMAEITAYAEFVVWWISLGILSSVGLGSGMHTGILFLFPHIFKVTWTAEMVCGHVDFDSRQNMFGRLPNTEFFACGSPAVEGVDIATLFGAIYWKALPAAFLWGAGTAMGEIPPYWTAYAAKMSGETDEEIDEVEQLGNADDSVATDPLTATKIWMVKFMQRWGFWGVFLMSAWPNALFDLCGICCGTCLMPFWHFFSACWLGKACVKAPLQLVVLVSVFSEHYRGIFIDSVTGEPLTKQSPVSFTLLLTAVSTLASQPFSRHRWGPRSKRACRSCLPRRRAWAIRLSVTPRVALERRRSSSGRCSC